MSTKVYNLYRYAGGDVESLLVWLKQLRVGYMKHVRKEIKTLAPRDANGEVNVTKLQYRIERDTKLGYRSPFNIDASACIYLHEGQIYAHFFADQVFLTGYIESADDIFVDCHYQNQSDQPDNVSDEEWDKRRETVEAIGILDMPPSRAGFIFVFADEHDIFDIAYNGIGQ